MTHFGDALITLEAANPDASPLRQAYSRWWETPRAERPRPMLTRIAVRLHRLADRLAPAPKATPSEVTHKPVPAARAAGQP